MGKVFKYVKGHNIKIESYSARKNLGEYTASKKGQYSHHLWPLSSLMHIILSLTLQCNYICCIIFSKALVMVQNNIREILCRLIKITQPASWLSWLQWTIWRRWFPASVPACFHMVRGTSPFTMGKFLTAFKLWGPSQISSLALERRGSCLTSSC